MATSGRRDFEQGEPSRKKAKAYDQKYLTRWEAEPKYKGWLAASKKGPLYFYCKSCNADCKGEKSEIDRHLASSKHRNSAASLQSTRTLTSMPAVSGQTQLDKSVKEAEIRLAAFITEHNLPFNVMGHLVDVVKAACDDSQIAKNVSCGRTKCTAIVKNVLGEQSRQDICELLRRQKFSLLVDESTDMGTVKHLSLVARVMNANGDVVDAFLDLVPVSDGTAQSLFSSLKAVFTSTEIPYERNLIGFSADGANVMMDAHHSVASMLQAQIPGIFILKCICHFFHLCASYACKTLPRGVEDLARDVYNYFLSPKQTSAYQEVQRLAEVKSHKLLHPSQTRWLSLQVVVTRLLEQMLALISFFKKAATEDRVLAAEAILEKLSNPSTKLYLEFLEYRDYLEATPLSDVQYKDPAKFLPLEEIYLVAKPTAALSGGTHGLNDDQIHNFRLRCLEFFIEAARQIYLRFPLKSHQLKNLRVLDPKVVMGKTIPSIAPLAVSFRLIVRENEVNELDREWRLLRNIDLSEHAGLTASQFWHAVSQMRRGDGSQEFPLLSAFMKNILCLPHSSAAVERVFSQVNLLKTKQRNRLSTDALCGLLHAKRTLTDSSCYTFQITPSHLKRMKKEMYGD
ncbi:hypothetical protein HPB51_011150 [Rhipicephalus microplus]|uniref:HAT C-terminal dimerisation domain-containing protein n=1 Tax=Rhipicephalus microplus TaxID=6941 RepID=A0A9J6E1P0_RHIMP|nr:hypothetical protein HPB51_011150 [Rhipicephalus microplus]